MGVAHGAEVINLSLEFPRNVNSCEDVPSVCEAIAEPPPRVPWSSARRATAALGDPSRLPGARAERVRHRRRRREQGCLADYSNFGEGLDIVAPGGGADAVARDPQCRPLASARGIVQLTLLNTASGKFTSFGYPHYEGTSMASAHAAGAAALVWAALRERARARAPTPQEVEARLEFTARREGGLADPGFTAPG